MTQTLATKPDTGETFEQLMVQGDMAKLSPAQRTDYYQRVCESLQLNPLTRPFEYITLNGKLTLYARKDCTDQLRASRGVSVTKLERERLDDLYVVTAYATDKTGRSDSSTGAVNVKGLAGENLANALMKAETKAKRRVTLSICGLGLLDELEAEDVNRPQVTVEPQTKVIEGKTVNTQTGEEVPADGLLRVLSVTSKPTSTGRGCWLVKLSDGRECVSFSDQEAALAEACAQVSEPVIVEARESKRGLDLVSIARYHLPVDDPAPAAPTLPNDIDASQIPF